MILGTRPQCPWDVKRPRRYSGRVVLCTRQGLRTGYHLHPMRSFTRLIEKQDHVAWRGEVGCGPRQTSSRAVTSHPGLLRARPTGLR